MELRFKWMSLNNFEIQSIQINVHDFFVWITYIRFGTENQEEMMRQTSSQGPKLEERATLNCCQADIPFLLWKHETTESGNKLNSIYHPHIQQLKLQLAINISLLSKISILMFWMVCGDCAKRYGQNLECSFICSVCCSFPEPPFGWKTILFSSTAL